jgi:hypothetical protein
LLSLPEFETEAFADELRWVLRLRCFRIGGFGDAEALFPVVVGEAGLFAAGGAVSTGGLVAGWLGSCLFSSGDVPGDVCPWPGVDGQAEALHTSTNANIRRSDNLISSSQE